MWVKSTVEFHEGKVCTELVVKTSHGFWKLFQQLILKTSNNILNMCI